MFEHNYEGAFVSSYDGVKDIKVICTEVREIANAGQKSINVRLAEAYGWSLPYEFTIDVCQEMEKIVKEYSNLKIYVTEDFGRIVNVYKSKNWQLSLFKPPKSKRR